MTLNEFCDANGLDVVADEHGTSGYVLARVRDGHPVCAPQPTMIALELEAAKHHDEIREAALVVPPSAALVESHRAGIAKSRAMLESLANDNPMIAFAVQAMSEGRRLDSTIGEIVTNLPLHKAEVERLDELARTAPTRLFLPIGTVVRLKADYGSPDHWALPPLPSINTPLAGTLGVVTSASPGHEFAAGVAFPDGHATADGGTRKNDDAEPSTLLFGIDQLEVVHHSDLLDGSPCLVAEFAPTHRYWEGGEDEFERGDTGCMLVVVKGFERGDFILNAGPDSAVSFHSLEEFESDILPSVVKIERDDVNDMRPL